MLAGSGITLATASELRKALTGLPLVCTCRLPPLWVTVPQSREIRLLYEVKPYHLVGPRNTNALHNYLGVSVGRK